MPAAEKITAVIPILVDANGPIEVIDDSRDAVGTLDPAKLVQYISGGEGLTLTTAGDVAEAPADTLPDGTSAAR